MKTHIYGMTNGQPVPPPPDGFTLIPEGGNLDGLDLMGYTEHIVTDGGGCWDPEHKVGWISSPAMCGKAAAGPASCFVAWAGRISGSTLLREVNKNEPKAVSYPHRWTAEELEDLAAKEPQQSEPHKVFKPVELKLYFTEITNDRATLPDIGGRILLDVLFFADGVMHSGYYHANGNFYSRPARLTRVFRGSIDNPLRRVANPIADGQVTHWCLMTNTKHPKFKKE